MGPKFALAGTSNAAILIPVGFYLGGGPKVLDTAQILSGMILSRPLGRYVEPIVSGKLVLPFKGNMDRFGVLTAAVSLSTSPKSWAVIPEVGMAWKLGDDTADDSVDGFLSVGVAATFFPHIE